MSGVLTVGGGLTSTSQPDFLLTLNEYAAAIGLFFTAATFVIFAISTYYDLKLKKMQVGCDCEEMEEKLDMLRRDRDRWKETAENNLFQRLDDED